MNCPASFLSNDIPASTALIVDDSKTTRESLRSLLAPLYVIEEADNGDTALAMILECPEKYCTVLVNAGIFQKSGTGLLQGLYRHGLTRQIPVFLLTSDPNEEILHEHFALGVMDIIFMPLTPYIVTRRVQSVVELFAARRKLSRTVHFQQRELLEQTRQIMDLQKGLIVALSAAIEFRNCESGQHVHRIHDITLYVLTHTRYRAMFSSEEAECIALAAVMHDVGKIAIPDAILNKPGPLTADEFEIMKTHTVQGARLLEQIEQLRQYKTYEYAHDIALHHHERWDGGGYPDGLVGDAWSLPAQVVALADVYDALLSKRVYKNGIRPQKALDMIAHGESGVFNPELLASFFAIEKRLRALVFPELV